MIVVALIVLVILGGRILSTVFVSEETTVPAVTGIPLEEAVQILQEHSLLYSTVYKSDPDVQEGYVISQDLAEGQTVRKDRIVELTVSEGPKMTEVPSVVGQNRTNAEMLLANRNLSAEIVEEHDSLVPVGVVIEQFPVGGEMVNEYSKVTLKVSMGAKQVFVEMPSIIGRTVTDATAYLQERQIYINAITYEPSDEFYNGEIIYQSVAEGTEVEQGSSVDVVVSEGPGPTVKSATVNYTVPDDGTEHTVRITVEDSAGLEEAYNAKVMPGQQISQPVRYLSAATITIYLDGEVVYVEDVK